MEVQRIAGWSDVRVLGYMYGKQFVREEEGKVCQRYRKQHAACLTIKQGGPFCGGLGQLS